jgi:ribose transport system substrate-binding protein
MRPFRNLTRVLIVAAAVALGTAGLAACGGATSNGSSSGSPAANAASSAEVKAAQASVATFEKPPAHIPLVEKLPSAPPTGKTFVYMQCEVASCAQVSQGIKEAMAAIGWNFKTVNFKLADPASLVAAFQQALTLKPAAVGVQNIAPEQGWSSVLPIYKAAGIPIITAYLDKPSDPAIIANVAGMPSTESSAKSVADWFIADSNGQGKALIERIDDIPPVKLFVDTLVKDIQAGCPKCDIGAVVQNTSDQIGSGKVVPSVVSALKRDPSIKYVLNGPLEVFDGLPSAMAAAGVDAKIAGTAPVLTTFANLKAGKFSAVSLHPLIQVGWVMTDIAIRHEMGLPIPKADSGTLGDVLLYPSSDFPTDRIPEYPADYAKQYEELWNVG